VKEILSNPEQFGLPVWAQVSEKRYQHIGRVVDLLRAWAAAMRLSADEANAWVDAGTWHDALRDADTDCLRKVVGDSDMPDYVLHGTASAILLARDGEKRGNVLNAIRYHTVGSKDWDRTGQALYMADFLEPGRQFLREERAELAARVPLEFEKVYGKVVNLRRAGRVETQAGGD
jgi:predicted HD superfamily hydrolase involved in NAD metabolism